MTASTNARGGLLDAAAGKITIVAVLLVVGLFLLIVIRSWIRRNQLRRHWAEAIAAAAVEDMPSPALVRLQRELARANAQGGLTKKEVDQAAPVSTYSAGRNEQDIPNCAICLDDIETGAKIRTLPCAHIFDAACVENWVSRANRCPVCNAAVVDKKAEPEKDTYTQPLRRVRRHRGSDGRFSLGNTSPVRSNEDDDDTTTSNDPADDTTSVPIANGSATSTADPPARHLVLDMGDTTTTTTPPLPAVPNAPTAPSVILNFSDKNI